MTSRAFLTSVVALILLLAPAFGGLASPSRAGSPMHPDVPLLDEAGDRVLSTGRPVSPSRTCGQCPNEYRAALQRGEA